MATKGSLRIPAELITKGFDAKLKQLQSDLNDLEKEGKLKIEPDADIDKWVEELPEAMKKNINELEEEVEKLSTKYSELVQEYLDLTKEQTGVPIFSKDREEAEALKEQIKQIARELERMTGQKVIRIPGITDAEDEGKRMQAMKKNFDGLLKSAKKLTLGIIGVGGAYAIFRKATSAIMAENKQWQADMEANWIGLGTIISDIIEMLIQGFRKLVIAVMYFMQCLTGTNYIAKANEAILRKQTKATNDLAKANDKLATSWDELTVMQDTSSGSVGANDDVSARLFDINELGANAIEVIERVARALKPVYEFVKDIVQWAIDHPEALIGILGGLMLLKFLDKVLGVAGVGGAVGTGLAGIYGVLLALLAIGTITISIITIYKEQHDLNEQEEANEKATASMTARLKEEDTQLQKNIKTGKLSREETRKITDARTEAIKTQYESAKSLQEEENQTRGLGYTIGEMNGHWASNRTQVNKSIEALKSHIETLKLEGDRLGWSDELLQDYQDSLRMLIDLTEDSVKMGDMYATSIDRENIAIGDVTSATGRLSAETRQNIIWNKEAREELGRTNHTLDTTDNWLDNIRSKIAEVNGRTCVINVKFKTEGSVSDKLIALGNSLGSDWFAQKGYYLRSIGLASGGIVNLPGRGVPLGNVVTGEVSAEGVIPLTDEQAMETMGRAIGRHVTIHATLINQMNGRTLNRELQVIQGDSDFAYNK